jgi:hypothetical protein
MFLISAEVRSFKSIDQPQKVLIDEAATVLVGLNEAGKTVFLKALEKSNDALEIAHFDPIEDYPRKDLPKYFKQHQSEPTQVSQLTYQLSDAEIAQLNTELHTKVKPGFTFSIAHFYNNTSRIEIKVDEAPVLESLASDSRLSSDASTAIKSIASLRDIPDALNGISLSEEDKAFVQALEARITKTDWTSIVQWETWDWLKPRVPKFLYFSDYELLPNKVNLTDLAQRVEQAESDPRQLKTEHHAALGLLRMANISVTELTNPGGYETLKTKLEGVSIDLTDQIIEFWKQHEDLEVEVDIKPDPEDEPPYNNGPNLYLRIRNRRHRGVSTPIRQRSHGFIWFFSFLVWFDSVHHQIHKPTKLGEHDLILLLDEPGLSLHPLAQLDLLRYIDRLATRHQLVYTTHSPFMVHSDRLGQVRIVEDQPTAGTVISESLSGSDARSAFPLQAALAWSITENLFISECSLLVQGPSDLIYLKALSARLEARGRIGLREDIIIVPTCGLDKVVTFVALLGANRLKLAVLHHYRGEPEQKLMDLVKQKMISANAVLNTSQFRDLANIRSEIQATDTEDLFDPALYVEYFNNAFAKPLSGVAIRYTDLPSGDRIVDRLERYLEAKQIRIRPSGGFNRYVVASYFASYPPLVLDADTLKRFEELFKAVNALF